MVAERRIELLISRLSIERFKPTKLLRDETKEMEPKSGVEPLTSCIPGRRSSNLSYFGMTSGADGRTRTCDELGVGQPI